MKILMLMWAEFDAAGGDQGDIDAWVQFEAELREAGVPIVERGALQPARSEGKVVRTALSGHAREGAVTEGTHTEKGPQIEAFYLLDCADLDEGLEWAHRLPTYGEVEVRPLLEYDMG